MCNWSSPGQQWHMYHLHNWCSVLFIEGIQICDCRELFNLSCRVVMQLACWHAPMYNFFAILIGNIDILAWCRHLTCKSRWFCKPQTQLCRSCPTHTVDDVYLGLHWDEYHHSQFNELYIDFNVCGWMNSKWIWTKINISKKPIYIEAQPHVMMFMESSMMMSAVSHPISLVGLRTLWMWMEGWSISYNVDCTLLASLLHR